MGRSSQGNADDRFDRGLAFSEAMVSAQRNGLSAMGRWGLGRDAPPQGPTASGQRRLRRGSQVCEHGSQHTVRLAFKLILEERLIDFIIKEMFALPGVSLVLCPSKPVMIVSSTAQSRGILET